MRNGHHTPANTTRTYLLPASAHETLTGTRDHLRLLAQLTEPQGEAGPDVVYLSAQALADCFDRLAEDLDRVTDAVHPIAP